ncbi:hypothetical protein NUM3379_19680 [Kineococcus sp. NUM-3379]
MTPPPSPRAAAGLLVVALLTGGTLSACAGAQGPTTTAPPSSAPAVPVDLPDAEPVRDTGLADVTFARQLLVHHQHAIELAGLAASRAGDPEVQTLASDIARSHGMEMTDAAGWLQEHGETAAPPAPADPNDGDGLAGLLDAEGDDVDRLFLELIAEHHAEAVALAETEQAEGEDSFARALAGLVESERRGELRRVLALRERF